MPVDTSPATSAQSLLNGIDYSALIGGPLEAAIKAQAMAAQSTWQFIQNVGLQEDKDGNKSAVNVTFLYQKDGQMVKLIVPILTIVPIPLIVIDDVSIAFKANINASASSSSSTSDSQDVSGSLSGTGKVGWGPFSISATLKASYSSKKDSKATQDSQYSVEYTQDVSVHATQAGMPAGLATVLNILSSAATGASRDGAIQASPTLATVDFTDPDNKQQIQVKVVDGNGLNVKGATVNFDVDKTIGAAMQIGLAPFGQSPAPLSGTVSFTTKADGTLSVMLWPVDKATAPAVPGVEMDISVKLADDKAAPIDSLSMPVKIVAALPAPPPPK